MSSIATDPGLCAHCQHVHRVRTRRGSTFYRCTAADHDARLSRYPPLPVTRCVAYCPTGEEPGSGG